MRLVIFIISILLIVLSGCKKLDEAIHDLEIKSLASGIRCDTIFGDLKFGMSKAEVMSSLSITNWDKYSFNVQELNKYFFHIYPSFFNDSLYSIKFMAYNSEHYLNEYDLDAIIELYTSKYDNPDTTYITTFDEEKDCHNVWLKGNLKIDIGYSESNIGGLSIEYKDLSYEIFSKNKFSAKIKFDKNIDDIYTKDYYDKVYLPSKKEEINHANF